MKVPNIVFLKYSDVLLNHFKELTHFKGKEIPEKKKYSVWVYPLLEKPLFPKTMEMSTDDPRYFYRQYKKILKGEILEAMIDDGLLIKTAEFMGLTIPVTIKKGQLMGDVALKARVMMQMFIKTYMPEYWEENRQKFEVFDEVTGERKDMIQTISLPNGDLNVEFIPKKDPNLQAVNDVVTDFYEAISIHDFTKAWDLLVPSFRKRGWQDQFDKFELGYIHTIGVHGVHVFDIVPQGKNYTCKVYYQDIVVVHTSLEHSNLSKIPISQMDVFIKQVQKIVDNAKQEGFDGLETFPIHKLFDHSLSEYSWYKCGKKPEEVASLFPIPEKVTIPRLFEITCGFTPLGIKIKAIDPLKPVGIR